MSKAILLSIRPKQVAKILNGEKTIEVRKQFPEDYVGWVYIYCCKGNKKNYHLIEVVDTNTHKEGYEYDYYIGSKGYLDWCLEGKVVAKFWCDKITEYVNGLNWEYVQHDAASYDDYESILEPSCLTDDELRNYVDDLSFYVIPISKLEIFDKPKELSEFHLVNKIGIPQYQFGKGTCEYRTVKKAPQNYCYVEGD